ncbi:MAG: PorV/PorQ family protein [Candidatus Zixiibacteriota bacterium]
MTRRYFNTAFKSFGALTICLVMISAALSAKSINKNAGTSSFSFLKINIGARAVAMGGAFTGLADDESALYYNPAGITRFEDKRFILGYHNYFFDMQTGVVGYIRPMNEKSHMAVHLTYLNFGDFIETDRFGVRQGEFSGGDLMLAASYAYRHSYSLSFGGTAKFLYEKVQDFSATGLAVDLGGLYTYDRERYRLGLTIQNLGLQLSALGDEKEKLPLAVRAGGSARLRGLPMTLAADLILPVDNDPVIAFGAEYYNFRPFYARLGWNSFGSNFRTGVSDDSWAGMSVGAGFDLKRMHLSYAFSPGADLGEIHRITLTGGL